MIENFSSSFYVFVTPWRGKANQGDVFSFVTDYLIIMRAFLENIDDVSILPLVVRK